jgi:SAM-dependent methyltransferase
VSDPDNYASQAELYDLAFAWDVAGEVAWFLDRAGPDVRSVLEPFCGNGRLFPELARRGIAVAGVDLSPSMLDRAAARMRAAGHPAPLLAQGDARDFDLGRTFDAAICPVNSVGHLHVHDDLVRHLDCVARHLRPGATYFVQLGLRDAARYRPLEVGTASQWSVATPHGTLRTPGGSGGFDAASRVETQVARFEWTDGPRAGTRAEFEHRMRLWDWDSWSRALAATPFRETAAWDGDFADRPPLPRGP